MPMKVNNRESKEDNLLNLNFRGVDINEYREGIYEVYKADIKDLENEVGDVVVRINFITIDIVTI